MNMKLFRIVATLVMLSTFVLSAAVVKRDTVARHGGGSPANVQGSGSKCLEGCNEPNQSCTNHTHTINGFPFFDYANIIQWYPHWECRFVPTFETCTAGQDTICKREWRYSQINCEGTPNVYETFTSTCGPDYIPPVEG